MIRAVLAVALAAALVALALPAIDDARERRADRQVRAEVAAIERAADSLLAADETSPGPGAKRVLSLSLPEASWTVAGVENFAVRGGAGHPGRRSAVSYVVGGRSRRIAVDAPLYVPDCPVSLAGGGDRRVVLELVRVDGRPAVAVRTGRSGSDERSERRRLPGFMPEGGTNPGHVHPRPDRRGLERLPLSV